MVEAGGIGGDFRSLSEPDILGALSKLTRLTRFAGERAPSTGTLLAPPWKLGFPFGGDGCGIKLERRRDDLSLRTGPICDRRRPLLVAEPGTRGVAPAPRPFGSPNLKEAVSFPIWLPRSERGEMRREGAVVEGDSSSSARLPRVDDLLFALR
jgi:hypothetical protein